MQKTIGGFKWQRIADMKVTENITNNTFGVVTFF